MKMGLDQGLAKACDGAEIGSMVRLLVETGFEDVGGGAA
jgi:hypothetical protein